MPNLAGMFDMRSRPADTAAIVARLSCVLNVPGVDYTVRSWHDKRFAAVNLLNGICGNLDQPATTADGEIILFLDGEVSNLDEIWALEASASSGDALPAPTRACLELYLRYGDDFVSRLNGQFNILLYDRPNRVGKVFNDRLAYRPFYYWCAGGLALFGLEKKAIFAALERTPPFDPMGILEFFAFGHNLDDRTIFSGVCAMPQGAVLEFKDSQVSVRRYWRPAYDNQVCPVSLDEAARELGRRLCRAVARRAQGSRRYGIFLSGGLDSRAAGGALARVRRDVTSFTFGRDDSPDLLYGRELAVELGFTYHRLLYEHVSFAELLPQVVWRTEGSIPFNLPLSIAHHRHIRANAAVIFNGHLGDVISGTTLKSPEQFLARDTRHLADHIVAKRTLLPFRTLRALFKRSFLDDAYAEMIRGIERALLALEEDRLPLARILWDMAVRQRRNTFSSPAVDRYVVEPVTPFTDNDVVDWMLTMPLRYLFGQRVYKRMIAESFPEIAHVPWALTGRRVSTNVVVYSVMLARFFAVKRLRRLFMRAQPRTPDPRLRSLKAYGKAGFAWDVLPGDLFDRDAVGRSTRAALDGRGSVTPLFLVLTLAECARLFGTQGLSQPPPETWPDL